MMVLLATVTVNYLQSSFGRSMVLDTDYINFNFSLFYMTGMVAQAAKL